MPATTIPARRLRPELRAANKSRTSAADAPEIDGSVFIENAAHLKVGEMVSVKIIDSDEHDMWAELV